MATRTELKRQIDCIQELLDFITKTLPTDINTAEANHREKTNSLLGVGLNVEVAETSFHHFNQIKKDTDELIGRMNGPCKSWLLEVQGKLFDAWRRSNN